jgi:hypothetical protein
MSRGWVRTWSHRTVCVALLLWLPLPLSAQDERARSLFEAAVRALGGEKYLALKSLMGRGLYSRFTEREHLQALLPFTVYIVYPDRERVEFGRGKDRVIQVNVGTHGWIYDGPSRHLRDQKEDEIARFRTAQRRSLETVMRDLWRRSDVKLRYLGERELWFRQRGVGVELIVPLDGEEVDRIQVYFDPHTHLPVKLAYEEEEERFYLYQDFDGIRLPLRIDRYRGDVQVSRASFEQVQVNVPIDPKLFEKPPSPDKVR